MFATPALAAARRQLGLQHRGRVGEDAVTKRANVLANAVAEFLQACAQHLVVVPPPRIQRHNALAGPLQAFEFDGLPAVRGGGGQVIHTHGDHTHGAGHQLGRARTFEAVGGHISHVTMEPLGQPRHQPRLGRGQIDTRHANLGESELTCPLLNLRKELTAAEHTPGIVETRPAFSAPPVAAASCIQTWHSEDDTQAFAARLAAQPALRNSFIELHGDLGAGKTTLVRHLLRALGVQGRIKSPTYAVVEPHETPDGLQAWHFDFYRFSDPREWEDAGFRDVFASPGLKLAEWPEKAGALLPRADLVIHIDAQADGTRRVSLQAPTATGRGLLHGELPA